MISISYIEHNKISLYLEKELLETKQQIIRLILSKLNKETQEVYLYIQGLGATIESYISTIKSKNFLLIDRYKYKFIVKELPELHLLSEHNDDLYSLEKFIDSFTEGVVVINLLKHKQNIDLSTYNNKQDPPKQILDDTLLKITIHSDGEVFDIESFDDGCNLMCICNTINNFILNTGDGTLC